MREKKTVSLTTIIVVLMATTAMVVATGCAGVFGLSDYSFDGEQIDGGGNEASTIDSPTMQPDASVDSGKDSGPPAPSCTDKVANGKETDVDCGGPDCPKCAGKKQCALATDCQAPLACVEQLCLSPNSSDMVQDGTETDVDCGGMNAPTCANDLMCKAADDCKSKVCDKTKLTCTAPSSTDGIQNGTETDMDCGGGTAPRCADGKKCVNGTQDCTSQVCTNQVCKAPTTSDNFKNGQETDVDCGGPSPNPKCIVGKACLAARDCVSNVCTGLTCQAAAVNDNVKNGTETDVDCGGGAAPACVAGKMCLINSDCSIVTSGVCTGGVCQVASGTDTVKNGNETDTDCGSSTSPGTATNALKCVDNKKCISALDCKSSVCNVTCQVPTPLDLVQNGNETDVDCGGGGMYNMAPYPTCADGLKCNAANVPSDCKSKVCAGGLCQAATYTDAVKNGTETDVDCGGAAGAPLCADTKVCVQGPRDCASGVCDAVTFKCSNVGANNVMDGNETDVDCGGPDPLTNRCAATKACKIDSDCTAGTTCTDLMCL